MSDDSQPSDAIQHPGPDWGAIAASAESKVTGAVLSLCELIIARDRLELLARVATFILFSKKGSRPAEEHARKSEVNLEYLCSLATALPASQATTFPSAEEVHNIIDLLTTIHMHATVWYTAHKNLSQPDDEALAELSKSFQVQKLHVRGEGYWQHLRQTWHGLMQPHHKTLQKAVGFSFDDYLSLSDRLEKLIEDRINDEADQKHGPYRKLIQPWIAELQSEEPLSAACQHYFEIHRDEAGAARSLVETFGAPASFLVEAQNAAEEFILKTLACEFGENVPFYGTREFHQFWPLNETLTDRKPFVLHEGRYYAFNFSKIGRSAYDVVTGLFQEAESQYWQAQFLPARDRYLEEETARQFRKLLPEARIITCGFYPLKAGGLAEADIVIVMDEVLLIVECKAGAITSAAKRGGTLRVKTDVKKTIAKGLNQAERLIEELGANGELTIQNKRADKISLKADEFRWVFRVNVTLDLISSVASNILSLMDIGLVETTERCWSVSLNDLRVVVDILDIPAVFFHYLIRRFDTDQERNVEASDELDYMMYYVRQGLFFRGKNKPTENEHLTIVGYTEDLDQYYRRKQGLIAKGAKPRVVLGAHTERFLELLEKWRPKGWMTAVLQFLEFDPRDREKLLGKIHLQLKRVLREKAPFGLSVIGCTETRTAIGLACAQFPHFTKEAVRARCIQRCKEYEFDSITIILVGIPVVAQAPFIFFVTPDERVPDHAKNLLAQLRFEITESRPQTSRPGIFDGLRENVE